MTRSVGIVGFRGYSGAELVRILGGHTRVDPVLIEHRSDSAAEVIPRGAQRVRTIACNPDAVAAEKLAVVFLATPPEVSMELTPWLLRAGAKVIDLSGAFRLRTAENYKQWYKADHTEPELLGEAAYGLPEFCRERIKGARLVSNPGCFPTAANLAIKPLMHQGVIDRSAGIVCDAKSGVSGAGRKPSMKTKLCEVTENFSAYSLLTHRHVPEVLMNSGLQAAESPASWRSSSPLIVAFWKPFTSRAREMSRGKRSSGFMRISTVMSRSFASMTRELCRMCGPSSIPISAISA